jgi:hypothetical protein
MQAIKPNSGLNYQSLDSLFHIAMSLPERKFKYNHFMRLNNREVNFKIGDRIQPSNRFTPMSLNGVKRDGLYEGNLIESKASKQTFRFPLYKTVEEFRFYRN